MQHDKDLDEVDFEDPNAISYSPSVSLTPSVTPSERPTSTPSAVPTRTPSASPSQSPTSTPSAVPTRAPSASPSQSPSATPSLSLSPTMIPSQNPSASLVPSMGPTAIPSSDPTIDCTSDETGSFGYLYDVNNTLGNETTSLTVNYYYELETSTAEAQVIQSSILPSIERAISDQIIALLFRDRDECAARIFETNGNLRLRHRQLQQERRTLEVVGVSANPPDLTFEDGTCQIGGQASSNNATTTGTNGSTMNIFQPPEACSVVQGQLTLFVKTVNVEGDEEDRVKELIREGMEDGDFVKAHPDIIQLYYIDNFDENYVQVEDTNEGGVIQDLIDQFGVIPLAIVAAGIAMVCFLCVVLVLCLRNRKDQDSYDDCNDDGSMSSSFSDHPSSVITTTNSSLNVPPPPVPPQKTTLSLDIHKDEDGYGSA